MADVFISYSRKDTDFVRRLHNALLADDRETWVDWEGIPLSADWWAEIQAAIEAADTFVFVISPDSIVSKVCQQEIDAAVTYGKRIVPILYREVVAGDVHPEVGRLNWIFFRDGDAFEPAFGALMETLNTDLDWVKAHTRLTRKAAEWERSQRKESRLLRGDDLADAEQRLARTDKSPPFTKMHGAYIWASRESAIKRQRWLVGSVSAGLVVAVVLAIIALISFWQARQNAQLAWNAVATAEFNEQLAYTERDRADQAKATAEANAQLAAQAVARAEAAEAKAAQEKELAQSRKLAADSLAILDADPELSILLALQGLEITYSDEAEVALRTALQAVQGRVNASYSREWAADAPLDDLQATGAEIVSRALTSAECQKYLHQDCL